MRLLSYLTTFLVAALLASCGGGGGSPGISSGPTPTLTVAGPSALTLQVGLTQQYVVQGGVKPYSVFSSNPAVAVGWLVGENVLAVGTSTAGAATVTVQDARGSKFDMLLTAGSSTPFFTTVPPTLLIAPGALGSQTYKLGGGTPPYKAVSSFPAGVSVVVNGNDITITALQVAGSPILIQSATVTMTDSSAIQTPLLSTVSLGSITLAVVPTVMTGFIGDIFRAAITGGTPPYRAIVSIDESLLSARIVNGNQLEVVGGQTATAAGVQILDSNNVTVSVSITLSAGQDVLRIQPSTFSFPESATTPDITIMAYGASATGGIQVFSSDPTLLKPLTPVKTADGSGYSITLTGGNTCSLTVVAAVVGPPAIPAQGGNRVVTITVYDSKGKIGTSTLTVIDSNGIAGC